MIGSSKFSGLAGLGAPPAGADVAPVLPKARTRRPRPTNVDREMRLDPTDRRDHLARIEAARDDARPLWAAAEQAKALAGAAYARLGESPEDSTTDLAGDAWDLAQEEDATTESIDAHRWEALDELGEADEAPDAEPDPDALAIEATHDLAKDLLLVLKDLPRGSALDVRGLLGLIEGEYAESPKQSAAKFAAALELRGLVDAYAQRTAAYVALYPRDEREHAEEVLRDLVFGEET